MLRTTPLAADATLAGFLRWDGRLARESADAALYEVWLRAITREIAARISKDHGGQHADLSPKTVLRMLSHPDSDAFGADAAGARNTLLGTTLAAARRELGRLLGADASKWSWGTLHVMQFRHALDRLTDTTRTLDPAPVPRPGDGYTVNATFSDGDSWGQVDGATYREILDTSDWDRSLAINTPGQSGQPGSRHYSDLLPLWDAGRYFPLAYSRQAVDAATIDTLLIEP